MVNAAKLGFGWLLVSVESGNLVNQFLLPKSHDPGPFVCMSSSRAFVETKHFLGQEILFRFLDLVFMSCPALILPKNSCSLPLNQSGPGC